MYIVFFSPLVLQNVMNDVKRFKLGELGQSPVPSCVVQTFIYGLNDLSFTMCVIQVVKSPHNCETTPVGM